MTACHYRRISPSSWHHCLLFYIISCYWKILYWPFTTHALLVLICCRWTLMTRLLLSQKVESNAQCVLCSVSCPCIFYSPVVTSIRRWCGYRGILRGKSRIRVWKSQKCEKMHSAHSSKLGQIYTLWDTKTHILWFKHSDSIIQLVLSPEGAPPNEIEGLSNQGPVQRPEAEIPPFKDNFQGAG